MISADDPGVLRSGVLGQKGSTVWLTGFSGAGKSTIARELERQLLARRKIAYVLDGDNIRKGLNRDLGFSPRDREENIRRIGEVARLFADTEIIAIIAFISPYRADRDRARALHDEGSFFEIHVDCPLQVCEARDTKGLYARARRGEVADFTGISAPYEAPESPELRLDTSVSSLPDCVAAILALLNSNGRLQGWTAPS